MKLTNIIRDAFVRAVIDDVPQVDYEEQIRSRVLAIAVSKLPAPVRKIWDDKELRSYVKLEQEYITGMYLYVPTNGGQLKFTLEEQQEIDKLEQLRDAQEEKLADLRAKVRAVAYSATTTKALLEQLPEFEKYLPADARAASRMVPAVANLVADLVQAGWPDGGKKKDKAGEAVAA